MSAAKCRRDTCCRTWPDLTSSIFSSFAYNKLSTNPLLVMGAQGTGWVVEGRGRVCGRGDGWQVLSGMMSGRSMGGLMGGRVTWWGDG